MERNQLPQAQVINEQQHETEHRNLANRLKYYAAIGAASVVGLVAVTAGRTMITDPESASAEDVPAATTPGASASLEQQCVKAALKMPKTKYAYMSNPGKRPWEDNPHVVGPIQSSHVRVEYPAVVPPGQEEVAPLGDEGVCDDDVLRVVHGELQKKVGKRWRRTVSDAGWRHRDNEKRTDVIENYDSVHGEPEWMFWHPGDHFRVLMKNTAKDPESRKTIDTREKAIPLQIRRGQRHAK